MRFSFLLFFVVITIIARPQELPFEKLAVDGRPDGSRGVAFGDFNNDGWLDLVVANQVDSARLAGNPVYVNKNGTMTQMVPLAAGSLNAWSESVSAVDVDNDHDLDLFFTTQFGVPNLLFINDGIGNFSESENGDLTSDLTNSPGSCWCDFDLDGDMDAFVVNRDGEDDMLYINDGRGTFTGLKSGPWIGNGGDGRACVWGDVNGDKKPDLYVVNFVVKENGSVISKHRNYLYLNSGGGKFKEQREGILVEELNASYGVSMVDYDYDHDLDIYVTNVSVAEGNALYRNSGDGTFEKLSAIEIGDETKRPSKGQTWGDFNNDGWLDVYVANGTEGYPEIQNFFFLGTPDFKFKRIYNTLPAIEGHISAGAASGDFDNDGDLDIYVCNWGDEAEANDFYVNETTHSNWIKFRLRGSKSNTYGMGSWLNIELEDGSKQTRYVITETGYGSRNAPEIHFGLGESKKVKTLRIEWPNGQNQSFTSLDGNHIYEIREGTHLIKKVR